MRFAKSTITNYIKKLESKDGIDFKRKTCVLIIGQTDFYNEIYKKIFNSCSA